MDLEPNATVSYQVNSLKKNSKSSEDQLENAVIRQELMAAKEEMADLKAKIYVSDKEKRGKKITVFQSNASGQWGILGKLIQKCKMYQKWLKLQKMALVTKS